MELHLDLDRRRDLTGQIYRALRAAILEGRLRRGERLPPSRELAPRLQVSRNTVALAYEWLAAEGLLAGRSGAGSFVQGGAAPGPAARPARGEAVLRTRPIFDALPDPLDLGPAPAWDFRAGIPDAQLFPFESWRRLVARQLRPAALAASYGEAAGHRGLREAVARHVALSRGVRASADEVLITNGAQQALDLVGRVLVEPGTCVAVEEPGYPPARLLFQSLGARVVPVPVDADGLRTEALPDEARLVYLTPAHQFPLGVPLGPARRTALLAWAARQGAVVIEDDYDSEFRFGGRPLPTLHSQDQHGRVVYVGSFSKAMLPALRLGFLVAPPALQRPLRLARHLTDWHSQLPTQAALARFIDEGLLARHLRRMRREYQARHQRIEELLVRRFGDRLRVLPSVAGMHLCALLHPDSRRLEREVARRAEAAGVGLARLSPLFAAGPGRAGLLLGYGAIPLGRIDEGLRRLRGCLVAAQREVHPKRAGR